MNGYGWERDTGTVPNGLDKLTPVHVIDLPEGCETAEVVFEHHRGRTPRLRCTFAGGLTVEYMLLEAAPNVFRPFTGAPLRRRLQVLPQPGSENTAEEPAAEPTGKRKGFERFIPWL